MTRALVVCVLLALVTAPGSFASEKHPTSLEVQEELFCADCNTTLAEANVRYSGEAIGLIMDRIAAGFDFNDHALLRFQERIKDAVDPRGIIAPGKQGVWPARFRRARSSEAGRSDAGEMAAVGTAGAQ